MSPNAEYCKKNKEKIFESRMRICAICKEKCYGKICRECYRKNKSGKLCRLKGRKNEKWITNKH